MIDGLELLFRPLVMLGRFLLWLVWELFIEVVAWAIGWVVCKAISFGRWPKVKFNERENLDWAEASIVLSVGVAAMCILFLLVAA